MCYLEMQKSCFINMILVLLKSRTISSSEGVCVIAFLCYKEPCLGTQHCTSVSLFIYLLWKERKAGSAIKQQLDSILLARWAKGSLTAGVTATTTDYSAWNHLFSFCPCFSLFFFFFTRKSLWPHFLTWHTSSSE